MPFKSHRLRIKHCSHEHTTRITCSNRGVMQMYTLSLRVQQFIAYYVSRFRTSNNSCRCRCICSYICIVFPMQLVCDLGHMRTEWNLAPPPTSSTASPLSHSTRSLCDKVTESSETHIYTVINRTSDQIISSSSI